MKAVNKVVVAPDNAAFFDQVCSEALMKAEGEDVGQVMLGTKVVDEEGNVNVLLVFPTQVKDPDVPGPLMQPTAIVFTLNCFLNAARMLAIQHQAVIQRAEGDPMPEAMTAEGLPRLIVPRSGNG
jgi:hypothetical protein